MKITLYGVDDEDAKLIKEFLIRNNLKFEEKPISEFKYPSSKKYSILEVKYSHSIHVCNGYQEHFLNQILEPIKKYNARVE